VTVGVDGDLDAVVSHLLFDVGQRFAVLDEEAGEGVAEVVNSYIPEPCLCQELTPDTVVEVCLVQRLALLIGEHPLGHLPPPVAEGLLLPFDQ
jgi:hypothetical protein